MKILIPAILISMGSSFAQMSYKYELPFRMDEFRTLGSGHDAEVHEERPYTCVDFVAKNIDGTPSINTRFKSEFVSSSNEILETLDIKGNFSADYKVSELFGGNTTLSSHYNKYFKMNSSDIALMISFQQDHGREGTMEAKIKPEYQQILDAGEYEQFKELCGTHYINMVQKKSLVMVLVKISGLSSTSKKDFILNFKQKFSTSFLSASGELSLDYQRFIQQMKKMTSVKIEFFSVGGNGVKDITSIINGVQGENLQSIITGIADFARNVDQSNAAPVKYSAVVYPGYPLRPLDLTAKQARALDENIEALTFAKESVNNLIEQGDVYSSYSSVMEDYLLDQQDRGRVIIEKCFYEKECDMKVLKKMPVLTKDNLFEKSDVKVNCHYEKFYKENTAIGSYLSSIDVVADGHFYFGDYVNSIDVYKLYDSSFSLVADDTSGSSSSWSDVKYDDFYLAKYWFNKWSAKIDSVQAEFTRDSNRKAIFSAKNLKSSKRVLEVLKDSQYWIKANQFNQADDYLYLLGAANMRSCPYYKPL